jgi:hypothetical protein
LEAVRNTLNAGRDQEEEYHNQIEKHAEGACQWIEPHPVFSSWASGLSDLRVVALIGDMGTGKTITTAYVAKVRAHRHAVVCRYHCKDIVTTDLGKIYRSLLWQLVKAIPDLKSLFHEWYHKELRDCRVDPTKSVRS